MWSFKKKPIPCEHDFEVLHRLIKPFFSPIRKMLPTDVIRQSQCRTMQYCKKCGEIAYFKYNEFGDKIRLSQEEIEEEI